MLAVINGPAAAPRAHSHRLTLTSSFLATMVKATTNKSKAKAVRTKATRMATRMATRLVAASGAVDRAPSAPSSSFAAGAAPLPSPARTVPMLSPTNFSARRYRTTAAARRQQMPPRLRQDPGEAPPAPLGTPPQRAAGQAQDAPLAAATDRRAQPPDDRSGTDGPRPATSQPRGAPGWRDHVPDQFQSTPAAPGPFVRGQFGGIGSVLSPGHARAPGPFVRGQFGGIGSVLSPGHARADASSARPTAEEQAALFAYEIAMGLPAGTATLGQVAATSAGIAGFAGSEEGRRAHLGTDVAALKLRVLQLEADAREPRPRAPDRPPAAQPVDHSGSPAEFALSYDDRGMSLNDMSLTSADPPPRGQRLVSISNSKATPLLPGSFTGWTKFAYDLSRFADVYAGGIAPLLFPSNYSAATQDQCPRDRAAVQRAMEVIELAVGDSPAMAVIEDADGSRDVSPARLLQDIHAYLRRHKSSTQRGTERRLRELKCSATGTRAESIAALDSEVKAIRREFRKLGIDNSDSHYCVQVYEAVLRSCPDLLQLDDSDIESRDELFRKLGSRAAHQDERDAAGSGHPAALAATLPPGGCTVPDCRHAARHATKDHYHLCEKCKWKHPLGACGTGVGFPPRDKAGGPDAQRRRAHKALVAKETQRADAATAEATEARKQLSLALAASNVAGFDDPGG